MLRRNVLIFHSGALGDFVLTWPVAMALARVYAQSRVFYVTAGEKGKLAERVLGVEARDVEGGWQHLFGDVGKLPEGVRRTLEGTSVVVNFVAGEGDGWLKNVSEVSRGAEVLTVRPGEGEAGRHVSEMILDQFSGNRVLHAAVGQMIASVNEKGAGTVWKGGGKVVLHPGSGGRAKCWAIGKWVELARRMKREEVQIVLGEVERERLTSGEIGELEGVGEVVWPADYAALLGVLATARGFVGNDSGPGHVAGVIGVPSVVVFGPTDPAVWRPLGPRVVTARGEGETTEGVSVGAVWELLQVQMSQKR